jgi:hypothetical protein
MKPKGSLEPIWYSDPSSAFFFSRDVEWHMSGYVFYKYRDNRPVLLLSRFALPVCADGRVIDSPTKKGVGYSLELLLQFADMTPDEERMMHIACFQGVVWPAFLALSFMHCRNVKVRTEVPPVPLSKKHERKTGRPLLRYRVLEIDHMKQMLEREGGASTQGLKKALHICRGHFKHYGRDGKGLLFGKHTATVWVPMHSRGSAEEGVVVKDYDVK